MTERPSIDVDLYTMFQMIQVVSYDIAERLPAEDGTND